jgi:hypothetical protein
VQKADEAACVAYGLFEPDDGFGRAAAGVAWVCCLFGGVKGMVGLAAGEEEEESKGGAGERRESRMGPVKE